MTLSHQIKLDCFLAFVHSRFVGLGEDKDGLDEVLLKQQADIDELNKRGNPIVKYISGIATLESINKKIVEGKSSLIANMYHDNYSKLLKLMEDKVKNGDEIINSVIGVGLLIGYMENDKYEKTLDIKLNDLIEILDVYQTKSKEHISMVTNMMKIATYIVEKYWKEIKRK